MLTTADRLLIEKQTNITDANLIETTFKECSDDVFKTICALLKINDNKEPKQPTVFDDLRMICDEKATIFQTTLNYLNKNATN
jgi:hypothetical protein